MTVHKAFAVIFFCVLALAQTQPQCKDYCYIKESALGKCTICYNDCKHSAQSSFLSCSIVPLDSSQNLTLTQTACESQCYPEIYSSLTQQALDEEQPQITLEELQKLKGETEGWTSEQQRLTKAGTIMFSIAVVFIAGFTLVWRQVDKRRKLKQLQLKQQKQWVKCFEKVNTSDTTLCSVNSRQVTAVANE